MWRCEWEEPDGWLLHAVRPSWQEAMSTAWKLVRWGKVRRVRVESMRSWRRRAGL